MRPLFRHQPSRPAAKKEPAPPPNPGKGRRALFIGNRLTYANNLRESLRGPEMR